MPPDSETQFTPDEIAEQVGEARRAAERRMMLDATIMEIVRGSQFCVPCGGLKNAVQAKDGFRDVTDTEFFLAISRLERDKVLITGNARVAWPA